MNWRVRSNDWLGAIGQQIFACIVDPAVGREGIRRDVRLQLGDALGFGMEPQAGHDLKIAETSGWRPLERRVSARAHGCCASKMSFTPSNDIMVPAERSSHTFKAR